MDHNRAAETQAVERYLLGEMKPQERDDFEEHFFDCEVCSREVRSAARFRANAREVLRNPDRYPLTGKEKRAAWWQVPVLIPLAACLTLVVIYQNGFEIPALRRGAQVAARPVAEPVTSLMLQATTRGASDKKVVQIPRNSSPFYLTFEMLPQPNPPAYQCTIEDASGRKVVVVPVPPPQPGSLPGLNIYPQSFSPGRYHVTVQGLPASGSPASIPLGYEFEIN